MFNNTKLSFSLACLFTLLVFFAVSNALTSSQHVYSSSENSAFERTARALKASGTPLTTAEIIKVLKANEEIKRLQAKEIN